MELVHDVFADTAYWIALVDSRDSYRAQAIACTERITGCITTTSEVLTETANALCRPPWRAEAMRLFQTLLKSPDVHVVHIDQDIWRRGWHLYCERPDKSWSLTDCLSMIVMGDANLHMALTTDVHFEQAGHVALMRQLTGR